MTPGPLSAILAVSLSTVSLTLVDVEYLFERAEDAVQVESQHAVTLAYWSYASRFAQLPTSLEELFQAGLLLKTSTADMKQLETAFHHIQQTALFAEAYTPH